MLGYGAVSKHIYKTTIDNRAPSFCKCNFPRTTNDINNLYTQITCECGEDASNSLEWSWDTEAVYPETKICDRKKVLFHRHYSHGTSMIRGNKVLKKHMHHYWEIKILSTLSGTDVMIGIGTDKIDLNSYRYRFASALGLDDQSWGYSYHGRVQNAGKLKYYSKKFSQGCIIGVHLDLCHGSIEFYLNRRPQGKAFLNIPFDDNTNLYPMACSTLSNSSIKLINSASFSDSLQMNCMKVISKFPTLLNTVNKMPGLKGLAKQLWFMQTDYDKLEYSSDGVAKYNKSQLLIEDEAIVCGLKPAKKDLFDIYGGVDTDKEDEHDDSSDVSSVSSISDPYDGMHKIKQPKLDLPPSSDESNLHLYSFFCDH